MYCEREIAERDIKKMQTGGKAHYSCYDFLKNISEQVHCSGKNLPMLTIAQVLKVVGFNYFRR